jgi:hypothetical protein
VVDTVIILISGVQLLHLYLYTTALLSGSDFTEQSDRNGKLPQYQLYFSYRLVSRPMYSSLVYINALVFNLDSLAYLILNTKIIFLVTWIILYFSVHIHDDFFTRTYHICVVNDRFIAINRMCIWFVLYFVFFL